MLHKPLLHRPMMAKNRVRMPIFTAACLALALSQIGCSFQSVPSTQERQKQAEREEYERKLQADQAEGDRKRAEQLQRMIADPGSLSIQESDAQIAALHSPSAGQRIAAAEKLGDAKGPRAVEALIADLRTETDPTAFSAVLQALTSIHDPRATDAFVEALSAPNMSDSVREQALNGIVEFRSDWRLRPQIQRFYDSLTDESVRARVRPLVEGYDKKHKPTR